MAQIADPLPAGPTNVAQVADFEEYIGHRLPAEYREFLLQHNGGHPAPDAFLVDTGIGEQEDIVMCFFPLRDRALGSVTVQDLEELRTWPLHCAWDDLQSDLENLYAEAGIDEPLLPTGTDGSGNYFCIVLDGPRKGSVVFLDHETGETFLLGESFTAFLGSLRARERDDYAF
jgi:cell wall assembly regulator SMI1